MSDGVRVPSFGVAKTLADVFRGSGCAHSQNSVAMRASGDSGMFLSEG